MRTFLGTPCTKNSEESDAFVYSVARTGMSKYTSDAFETFAGSAAAAPNNFLANEVTISHLKERCPNFEYSIALVISQEILGFRFKFSVTILNRQAEVEVQVIFQTLIFRGFLIEISYLQY